jgi:PAS domain S-box-containing protein
MSLEANATNRIANLRERAVARLTPVDRRDVTRASPQEATAVLYQLASSPSTAADALALLHELQVHQVELDLQREELRASRNELESALARQTALVDQAPVGFVCVDGAHLLCEVNQTAERLLGDASDALLGSSLVCFVAPASVDDLETLLSRALDGLPTQTRRLELLPQSGMAQAVYARAARASAPGHVQLVLMPTD